MALGNFSTTLVNTINENFDASYRDQKDNYAVLLATDKLSEGFNLNRAGFIINYDIPWNPVRVIQRLGRINRIGKKVFDELYIANFFPTLQGSEFVKSREIASQKMYLIHNALGEDSKIFDIDEEPSPSNLYNKIMVNPDNLEEENFYTKVYKEYQLLKTQNPELFDKLSTYPPRIEVSKVGSQNELLVFFKRDRLNVLCKKYEPNAEVFPTSFEEVFDRIKADQSTKALNFNNDEFWQTYEEIIIDKGEIDKIFGLESDALRVIKTLLNANSNELAAYRKFLMMLKEDIIDYGTLPDYTLRRIANIDTEPKKAVTVLERLKALLKEDYLNKTKLKIKNWDKEIIIAIENRKEV